MSDHYTYLNSIIPDTNWQRFSMALAIGGGLLLLGGKAASRLRSTDDPKKFVVPELKLSLFSFFDLFIDFFVRYHDSVLGRENRKYVPFTGSVFLFLLAANLIGLIPGMPAATTTVWVNVGMAIVVFTYFNYAGIKQNGALGYFKHFCGPVLLLSWAMLPLELFSTTLRIFTLNLRIYWNITADHLVLGIFTDLVPFLVPCIFYALGTFVSFMQAFVFTTLTMIYIQLAVQHEEHHH